MFREPFFRGSRQQGCSFPTVQICLLAVLLACFSNVKGQTVYDPVSNGSSTSGNTITLNGDFEILVKEGSVELRVPHDGQTIPAQYTLDLDVSGAAIPSSASSNATNNPGGGFFSVDVSVTIPDSILVDDASAVIIIEEIFD